MAKEFLGNGWKFPVRLNSQGMFDMSEHEECITEAIGIIIKTSKGERVMQPDFGCNIFRYLFDNPDTVTLKLMEESVRESLNVWEPRINLTKVEASLDKSNEGKVLIRVDYTVRSTNNEFNLVYPFYLKE
ncbi:MAG: baseplate protein [Methanothrix sp.]|nr:MAG: baseplate protein [Methanothrix sp.]